MTKAVTVRLDDTDHEALARQAEQLRVSPGTLARMLVHAGLDCLRGFLDIIGVLETPEQVMSRSGLLKKTIEHGAARRDQAAIGPNRSELIKLAST